MSHPSIHPPTLNRSFPRVLSKGRILGVTGWGEQYYTCQSPLNRRLANLWVMDRAWTRDPATYVEAQKFRCDELRQARWSYSTCHVELYKYVNDALQRENRSSQDLMIMDPGSMPGMTKARKLWVPVPESSSGQTLARDDKGLHPKYPD